MSAEKRSFEDFAKFPGSINQDTNRYEFPKLYYYDKSGKVRTWSIFIRLIKEGSKQKTLKSNWNLNEEVEIPIKKSYLTSNIPEGTISELWTETGQTDGTIMRSAPTYPKEKNIGRSNYRDCFKQALIVSRDRYLKKINEGGRIKSEFSKKVNIKNSMYFPMLAKKWDEFIKKNKVSFPLYVQPKLDGLRCIAYYNGTRVVLYSRTKKEFPVTDNILLKSIKECLEEILPKYYVGEESLYLDGELYGAGIKLQDINRYTRSSSLKDMKDINIKYWIYDAFYPSKKQTFEERNLLLQEILPKKNCRVEYLDTEKVESLKELNNFYKRYIDEGYEGLMVRSKEGLYTTGLTNKGTRSTNLLKRKEVFTDEFEVIGFTEGNAGKEIGAVIWICTTENGMTFNVTPNLSYEERYAIYKDCLKNFKKIYANRLLTVEYRGLSQDNIPQHAKGISFREE